MKEKKKSAIGLIACLYVFVLLPIGFVIFAAFGKLDQGFASTVLSYIEMIANSPAGQFLWDGEASNGGISNGLNIPY